MCMCTRIYNLIEHTHIRLCDNFSSNNQVIKDIYIYIIIFEIAVHGVAMQNITNKEFSLSFSQREREKKTYVQYCYKHVIKNKVRFIRCCSFAENNIIFVLCEITETFKLFYIYLHDKVFFVFSPKNTICTRVHYNEILEAIILSSFSQNEIK